MKKAMRWYGSTNEIVTDRLRSCSAAAKELGCSEKQVTGRWANIRAENSHLPFDDEKGPFFVLGACIVYKSSPQSMPRFTIISTHRGHSQNAAHSSLTVMLLYLSGVHCWSHRKGSRPQYWCLRSFVWQHRGNCYPLKANIERVSMWFVA